MEITLDQLLESRDNRSAMQKDLMSKNPEQTLVCFTVVMPGQVKRNRLSAVIAEAGMEALRERFGGDIFQCIERDLETGFEAYLLLSVPKVEAKQALCEIEDCHPLGRLFDMDVIDATGVPISRSDAQRPARKCLMCDNEARVCMRNNTHTQSELQECIHQMVEQYVRRV